MTRWQAASLLAFVVVTTGNGEESKVSGSSRAERVALADRALWDRYRSRPSVSDSVTTEPQALVDMIAHHLDAVDGSQRFVAVASTPQVAAFANRVIRVQTEQIAQMQQWLNDWYPTANLQSQWSPMFTDQTATASDNGYLAVMIDHHEHAILMYSSWATTDVVRHNQLGLLLAHIAKGQVGEIAMMHQLTVTP